MLLASHPHPLWSSKDYRPQHHLGLLFLLLCFPSDGICPRKQSFGRAPTNSLCEAHRSCLLSLTSTQRVSKPAVPPRRLLTTILGRNNSRYFQSQILWPLTPCLVLIYLFWCHSLFNSWLSFDVHYHSLLLFLTFLLFSSPRRHVCFLLSFFFPCPFSPHISRVTN